MARARALSDAEIEQVAFLLAEHSMPQMGIAHLLGVSTTTINRAVKKALKDGLIVRKLEVTTKVSNENRLFAKSLRKIAPMEEALKALEEGNLSKHFQELHVFESGHPTDDYAERLKVFARPMAVYLSKLLTRDNVNKIGISWGVALLSVFNALKEMLPVPPRKNRPIKCIPIAGSPPDVELSNKTSSANLAGAFSRMLNGAERESASFSVGAWIPMEFEAHDVAIIRRFCSVSPSYEEAFKKDGDVQKLDGIITSVGATKDFGGKWFDAAANASGVSMDEFRSLTVGNIAGCFLAQPGLGEDSREFLKEFNTRWLGIQYEQLWKCAQVAARKERFPGVILIAVGEQKAMVVREAIKHGLVNILCCDLSLMKRLEEFC